MSWIWLDIPLAVPFSTLHFCFVPPLIAIINNPSALCCFATWVEAKGELLVPDECTSALPRLGNCFLVWLLFLKVKVYTMRAVAGWFWSQLHNIIVGSYLRWSSKILALPNMVSNHYPSVFNYMYLCFGIVSHSVIAHTTALAATPGCVQPGSVGWPFLQEGTQAEPQDKVQHTQLLTKVLTRTCCINVTILKSNHQFLANSA